MRLAPKIILAGLGLLTIPLGAAAQAAAPAFEDWNAKFQTTWVWQTKSPLASAYTGARSLSPDREKSYSFTATAAFGFRPFADTEIYFDPEVAQGVPLSGLAGLGGFTNGEIARTSGPTPRLYRARLYGRQTWGFGGGTEAVASDMNQLAGRADRRRLVLTGGNLSVLDLFDDNAYSHDPRTQFLNWALMTHGAYDYAADARGYSWGVALEYFHDEWAVRAGRFVQPREPNQLPLDYRILRHYGDQLEIEHGHRLGDQPGRVRLLVFRNRATMARFADALDLASRTGTIPDINAVRDGDRIKQGFGINVEQAVNADVGLFARASRADGKTETYAFTEIDRSLSGGMVVKGGAWRRSDDTFGVALVRNELSRDRRDYLARGGLSFFIGDGRLNYQPEAIVETFYSVNVLKGTWLTLDAQRIRNPAYNADRGPVRVASIRAHVEF